MRENFETEIEKPAKPKLEVHIQCVHCRGKLHVKIFREIKTPAVPAEVELVSVVEAETKTLFDETGAPPTPGVEAAPETPAAEPAAGEPVHKRKRGRPRPSRN